MAVLTFSDLKQASQIFVQEWTTLTVRDEPLIPASSDGTVWLSFWDNWLIPPDDPGSVEPIITINMIALSEGTDYNITQAGDGVRGKITLTTPPSGGNNTVVLATYRRSLFRDSFWQYNLQQAADEISGRVLNNHLDISNLDDTIDPWHIIVKQAGRNSLINLQAMLASFGRTQMEGMTVDFMRAGEMLRDGLTQLGGEIDRDVVTWRWKHQPLPRSVYPLYPIPGPFVWVQ